MINNVNLHNAAAAGNVDHLIRLIDEGADIEAKDQNDCTVLHIAASEGKVDCLSKLIEKGANIDAKNNTGLTPLYFAVYSRRLDCIIKLIEKGANAGILDNRGVSVISTLKYNNAFFKKIKEKLVFTHPELILFTQEAFHQKAISHAWHIGGKSTLFPGMWLEGGGARAWCKKISQDFSEFQDKFKTKYQDLLNNDNVKLIKDTLQDFIDEESNECILDKIQQGKPVMIPTGFQAHAIVILVWGDQLIICDTQKLAIHDPDMLPYQAPTMRVYHCRHKFTLESLIKIQQMKAKSREEYLAYIYNREINDDLMLLKLTLDERLEEGGSLPAQITGNCSWTSSNIAIRAMLMLMAARGHQEGKLIDKSVYMAERLQLIQNGIDCDNERVAFHQIATLGRGLKCIDKKRLDLLDHPLIQTAMRKAYLLPLDEILSKKLEEITNKYMGVLEGNKLTEFVTSLQSWKTQKKGSFMDYGNPNLLKLKKISL